MMFSEIVFKMSEMSAQNGLQVVDKMFLRTRFFNKIQDSTYFSVSEHSASFSLFKKKKIKKIESCGQGVFPPPRLKTCPQLIGFFDAFLITEMGPDIFLF